MNAGAENPNCGISSLPFFGSTAVMSMTTIIEMIAATLNLPEEKIRVINCLIGGGFGVAGWEYLIPPAEDVMRREALRPMRDVVRVARAELGTAAGLIGAAFVAFEALD